MATAGANLEGPTATQSVGQFLQGMGITNEEELVSRMAAMQAQLNTQQQTFEARMNQVMAQMEALTSQLGDERRRASQLEEEKKQVLALAAAVASGEGSTVDNKGVGQPWKYAGKADQNFQEWSSKFLLYVKAKFGPEVEKALDWAKK